jgi:3-oxoacyl-[acyl-carrier protein] reductase
LCFPACEEEGIQPRGLEMSFTDKVAVVTGSSRGIGRGIAINLAGAGCRVVVHGSRPSEQLDSAFEAVATRSGGSIKVAAALSKSNEIVQMFETVRSTFGQVDILVNNAATQNPSPLLELKEEDWDYVLAVNLKAAFLCTQHAGRMMRDQGSGKIVNISSVHAYDAKRNFAHYSSSKGGLETLTKSMALELAAYNIQVNSLVVGAIATDMTPVDRQQRFLSAVPAGRVGTVDEIARLVTFIVSDACDYLTGASIRVDGGLTLGFCASRPDL